MKIVDYIVFPFLALFAVFGVCIAVKYGGME
jgi:hypothetical protein